MSRHAAIAGLGIAGLLTALNLVTAFRISRGAPFAEGLGHELPIVALQALVMLAPGASILALRPYGAGLERAAWCYPAVLGLGGVAVRAAGDPLGAGLVGLFVVAPALFAITAIYLAAGLGRGRG